MNLPFLLSFARGNSVRQLLCAALVVGCFGAARAENSVPVPVQTAPVINFSDLAAQPVQPPSNTATKPEVRRSYSKRTISDKAVILRPAAGGNAGSTATTSSSVKTSSTFSTASALPAAALPIAAADTYSPTASPPPSASFAGLLSDLSVRKPDTHGAVGSNHLMITLASEVRIQNRQGGEISTVPLNSFWAGVGPGLNVFDPQVIYDPYGQHFIFSAEANAGATNAGVLLAVSQTSDPTGNWNRYFVRTDTTSPVYADSPHVGFNKKWIVVQADTFARTNTTIGTNSYLPGDFVTSQIYLFDKANLYANGPANPMRITITDESSGQVPALTYDTDVEHIHLVNNWTGKYCDPETGLCYGYLRIYSIGGPVNSPILTNDEVYATGNAGDVWADFPPRDNFASQLGSGTGVMMPSSDVHSLVYRGGSLFVAHTEYFPDVNPTRSGVGFWEIFPGDGFAIQRAIISDLSGQTHRAYPSLAVSSHFDVLVAYSLFSPGIFPSAAYSFRSGGGAGVGEDVPGTLRSEVVLKAGEQAYVRTNSSGQNLWGDWTATCVDPLNDVDLWTLQEYAATSLGGTNRWGTWWGRVSPFVSLALSMNGSAGSVLAGGNLTYNLTVINERDPATTSDSGARIVDTLPLGASFVSATASQGSCAPSNNTVVCDLGFLPDGGQATATIVITANAAGSITNMATVSANGIDYDNTDDTATVVTTVTPAANVAVSITDAPDPVTIGSNLTYSIVVTNQGPSPAAAVNVTNTLPGTLNFVSSQTTIGVCNPPSGGRVSCNLGTLLAGASATITIVGSATTAGNISDSVSAFSSTPDPVSANNSASTTTHVNARPSISPITNRFTLEDTPVSAISFTIGDAETASGSLTLGAASSDITIVPLSNIVFGGSLSNRTVTVTPAPNQAGTVTISISVTDGDGATSVGSFLLTVSAVNDLPTLDQPGNLTINEDTPTSVNLTGISSGALNESQILVVSASSSATAIVPDPVVTYTSPSPVATLNIAPVANASGTATITVSVNDGGTSNNIVTRTFTVTVNPVNDPPAIDSISNVIIPEDSLLQTVNLTGITSGAPNESQTLTVTAASSDRTIVPDPTVSYTSPNPTGSLSFLPPTNAFGVVTITVTVNDGGASNNITTRTFTISINPVNDAPTLDAMGNISLLENAPAQTIPLTGISSGASNENQTISITASSSDPSVVPAPTVTYSSPATTGSLTLAPVQGAFGTVTITVRLDDGASSNNVVTRTFTVSVTGVNDLPTLDAIGDLSLAEDSPAQTVNLTGISGGPPNESQAVTVTASSSDPSIVPDPTVNYSSLSTSGTLTVTPVQNAFGTAIITVRVNDGGSSNNIATRTFNVVVNPVNDVPTLDPLADVSILEDSGLQTITFTGVSSGAANENQALSLTVSSTDPLITGNLLVNYTSPAATGTITFTPAPDTAGSATVTVRVNDSGASNNVVTRSFTVTVIPVNDPPTLDAIGDLVIDEDSGIQTVNFTGISAGAPNETQVLSVTATSSDSTVIPDPIVTYTSPANSGTLRFTPLPNANGVVTINVSVNDGGSSNNIVTRSFKVTINPINDLPTLAPIADAITLEDTPITIPFDVFDIETPRDQLRIEGQSSNEEVVSGADITFGGTALARTVTIRPLPDQYGSATITVNVTDSDGAVASTSFELTVLPVNDAPSVLGVGAPVTLEDTPITIPFTIFDPESIPDDIIVSAFSATPGIVPQANLTLTGTGSDYTLTVVPARDQFGVAMINIVGTDPEGLSGTNTVLLTVLSVNDLPTISAIPAQTVLEDTPTDTLPITIADVETPAADLQLIGFSSDPAVVSSDNIRFTGQGANRFVTVTPNTNANGTVVVSIIVQDSDGGSATNTFGLTIIPVNDAPIFSQIATQRMQQDTTKVIGFILDDPETPGALTLTATSSNPAILLNSGIVLGGTGTSRTLTVSPIATRIGETIITLTARDPDGATSSRSFTLQVTARPVISAVAPQNLFEDQPSLPISFAVSDVETRAEDLVVTATSSDPSIVPSANITFSGTGTNRSLSIQPATNTSGHLTITLRVADLDDGTATTTFVVNVAPVNDLPFISVVSPQVMDEDVVKIVSFTVGDLESDATQLAVSARAGDPTLVSGLVVGGSGAARTLTITPVPSQNGSTPITLVVTDPDGGSTSSSFVLNINPVNDAPTLDPIANLTINEDAGPQTVTLTGLSSGAANESQVLSITASASDSSLLGVPVVSYNSPNTTATLTFTPGTNANGTATITVTVNDGGTTNSTVTRTFQVTVNPVNDAPTISRILAQGMDEDASLPVTITIGDVDGLAGLTVTAVSSNLTLLANSGIAISGSGSTRTLTLTPQTNQTGITTVTVTVQDGAGASASTSFELTVNPVNDAPAISSIGNQTIAEDSGTAALAFTVGDVESAASTLVVTAHSSNQQLLVDSNIILAGTDVNRSVQLVPSTNQSGSATVTLTVRDPEGLATTTSFLLTVTPVNDAPLLGPVADQTITLGGSVALPLLISDVDSPAANLIISGSSSATSVVPNANITSGGVGLARTLQVTPIATGTSTITVTLTDGSATAIRTFVLTVNAGNQPPTFNALSNVTINEDAGLQTVSLSGISANTVGIFANSSFPGLIPIPAVSYTAGNATGSLTFTPVANSNGTATITVTASNSVGTLSRTFLVTVNSVNDGPTINSVANQSTFEDTPITVPFTINDIDTPALLLNVTAISTNSALLPATNIVVSGAGTNRLVRITPAPDQFGSNSFITLVVSDGVATNSTSFRVDVSAVNDAPTMDPIKDLNVLSPGANQSINQTVTVTGISGGPTNEVNTLTVTVASSNTSVIPTPTVTYSSPSNSARLTITSVRGATGASTISVTVSDGQSTNSTIVRTFVVNIRPTGNTANPTITAIPNTTINEDNVAGPIGFTVGDSSTGAGSLVVAAWAFNSQLLPTNGVVLGGSGASRNITLTPAPNQYGTSVVRVTVTDAQFGSTNTDFVLTVNPVNDAPTITSISAQTIAGDATSAPIGFGVNDVDSPLSSLIVTATSSNPSVISNASIVVGGNGTNRALTITPNPGQSGTANITVSVSDGATNSTTSFAVTVNGANHAPTLAAIPDQTTPEDTATAPIAVTVSDLESPAANLTVAASSSNPALANNFNFGGSGNNRTLVITPAANLSGTATISVVVSDPSGASTTNRFLLTVTAVNDPPTLDAIADVLVNEGSGIRTVNLTGIATGASEANTMTVFAVSSNPDVVPSPAVAYTSPNATGTLSFTPVPGTNGIAVITVTVNDGGATNNSVSRTFQVTVNDKPSISPIADQNGVEDVVIGPLAFTVSDRDTAASSLILNATSSNQTLVPNGNILLGGSGANRTVQLTPAANQFGVTTITITATDTNNLTGSQSFVVIVKAANDSPALNSIADVVISEDSGLQTIGLSGISSGQGNETQTLRVSAISSNPALLPNPVVTYNSPDATGTLSFSPLPNANGSAAITVSVTDGGSQNNVFTRSFNLTVTAVNDPPAFDPIGSIAIAEDAGPQTLIVSGLTSGAPDETDALTLTATSSNPALIADPIVNYAGGTTATLNFTAAPNASGSAVITVRADDHAAQNNLFSRTFTITVLAANDIPTLSPIADLTVNENAGPQLINLSGITAGSNENDPLTVTATSSNPGLIPDPAVAYVSPAAIGTITLTPVRNASGNALITVTVRDGASAFSRSFAVTVLAVDDLPTLDLIPDLAINEASQKSINLTGISAGGNDNQALWVTARSANPSVIPDPQVVYTSPAGSGVLQFTPVANMSGIVPIIVTVADQGPELHSFSRTFLVTVEQTATTNSSPGLRIDKVAGKVVLSWPADATGFVLQSKLAFDASSTWTAAGDVPAVINGRCYVTNSPSGFMHFYQLAKVSVEAAPVLRIEKVGGNVVISWSANVTGYVLQSKPAFETAVTWATMADIPSLVGDRFYVTNAPTGFMRFYQLAKGSTSQIPRLSIRKTPNTIIISWPAASATWILESATEASPSATWSLVSGESAIAADVKSVTIPNTGFMQIFRLRSP